MSATQAELAQKFARQREKNLDFFRKYYPPLFKYLSNLAFTHVEVVISTEEQDIDLQINGQSVYGGKAKELSLRDANLFLEKYSAGNRLKTFAPPSPNAYGIPRFSTESLKHCVSLSPLDRQTFKGYPLSKSIPFVAFLGCGLGYQIEELVKRTDIINALIFEPDAEVFSASLYTVDWQAICLPFIQKKGYNLTFSINKSTEDDEQLRLVLQRELQKNFPLFPSFTTFLNHRGNTALKNAVKNVLKDFPAFSVGLSNYDDQARRLNNITHNMSRGLALLPKHLIENTGKPVVIAGSAPSIDNRIEDIKSHRDSITLVSAGTGLRPLIANGLKPDFHVELDPDYLIYELLSSFSKDDRKDITLLAINEVNPKVPELFDKAYLFFRSDDDFSRLFGYHDIGFQHCNPTCTNAAMGIFKGLGCQNIFMFGTDLGFLNNEYHHSKDSLYSEEETSEVSRRLQKYSKPAFSKNKLIYTNSVSGEKILTKPEFYMAKISIENAISSSPKSSNFTLYNCSDGAEIKGSTWLSKNEFNNIIESTPKSQKITSFNITNNPDIKTVDLEIRKSHSALKSLTRDLRHALRQSRLGGSRDLLSLINQCNQILLQFRTKPKSTLTVSEQAAVARLTRGSILHFLLVGLTHCSALQDEEFIQYAQVWRREFLTFLKALPEHFEHKFINQDVSENDPWLRQSLWDPESEPLLQELD